MNNEQKNEPKVQRKSDGISLALLVRKLSPHSDGGPRCRAGTGVPTIPIINFKLAPVFWFDEVPSTNVEWGELSFELVAPGPDPQYVNAVIPGLTGNVGWVLQNFPVLPNLPTGRYATTIDLQPLFLGGTTSLPLELFVTSTAVEDLGSLPTGVTSSIMIDQEVSYNSMDLNGRPGGPADPALVDPPLPNGSQAFDLSFGFGRATTRIGVPDEPQGRNECAPTSTGNSFAWLNTVLDLGLPDDRDEADEIRDMLSKETHMDTDPDDGTTDENMILGKLQFIGENHLPLTVEFQDDDASLGNQTRAGRTAFNKGNRPTFDFIFEQLAKGQDVELGMTWEAGAGHWVTVTGAAEFFGVQMLFYNDPDDKKDQTKFSFVGTSEDPDYFGFLELENEANNSIDIVVAESPIIPVLMQEIGDLGLSTGGENALINLLNDAQHLLEDGNPDNDWAACEKLNDLLRKIQKQRNLGKITDDQASLLITLVEELIDANECQDIK